MFDVFTASEALSQIDHFPDVYLTPGYGMASEIAEGGTWYLASWNKGCILYPFLLREIPFETDPEQFDIISPYGYAGVWSTKDTSLQDWEAFRFAFREWASERRIASEFIRVGGLIHGIDPMRQTWRDVEPEKHNETFAIETSRGYSACWDGFHSRTRTKVRKARKQGFVGDWRSARHEDVVANSNFRLLYHETMERIEAGTYYFFPDRYYELLIEHCQIQILEVFDADGLIAAAALMMTQANIAHLHLVGTRADANRAGVGTLIYDKSTEWAAEHDYDLLHIGGGLSPGDSLAYFKQGFGGKTCDYWTVRSVLDEDAYRTLVEACAKRWSTSVAELETNRFFPTYRQTR